MCFICFTAFIYGIILLFYTRKMLHGNIKIMLHDELKTSNIKLPCLLHKYFCVHFVYYDVMMIKCRVYTSVTTQ